MAQSLSKDDISEIFSRQQANGLFSALAVETACLNRMERLNRRRLDPSLPPAERRAARRPGGQARPLHTGRNAAELL